MLTVAVSSVTLFRYTPSQQGPSYNSGAKQRIIRMIEVQRDPMEPPKFKINSKIPRGPPSPPAPVLHSPPRKVRYVLAYLGRNNFDCACVRVSRLQLKSNRSGRFLRAFQTGRTIVATRSHWTRGWHLTGEVSKITLLTTTLQNLPSLCL